MLVERDLDKITMIEFPIYRTSGANLNSCLLFSQLTYLSHTKGMELFTLWTTYTHVISMLVLSLKLAAHAHTS